MTISEYIEEKEINSLLDLLDAVKSCFYGRGYASHFWVKILEDFGVNPPTFKEWIS